MQVANRWPTVVFIFGGPGTQKGKYIDSLVDQYGLRRITISEVLERELDEVHVYETRSAEMVNVGIGTVMQWFVKRMRTDTNAPGFLIDIVPNIKVNQSAYWLCGPAVERRSCAGELSLSCARPVADG